MVILGEGLVVLGYKGVSGFYGYAGLVAMVILGDGMVVLGYRDTLVSMAIQAWL